MTRRIVLLDLPPRERENGEGCLQEKKIGIHGRDFDLPIFSVWVGGHRPVGEEAVRPLGGPQEA